MFDFLSYVRDCGVSITLAPADGTDLIRIIISADGEEEQHTITAEEVRKAVNIDRYTGTVLDRMLAKIGKRRAAHYANMHRSRQMMERENFFRGK